MAKKKQEHSVRWRVDGHRPHPSNDPVACWNEALAHSEKHPRTPVILEQFITRKQSWWVTLVLKNGKWDTKLTAEARKNGEVSNAEKIAQEE